MSAFRNTLAYAMAETQWVGQRRAFALIVVGEKRWAVFFPSWWDTLGVRSAGHLSAASSHTVHTCSWVGDYRLLALCFSPFDTCS